MDEHRERHADNYDLRNLNQRLLDLLIREPQMQSEASPGFVTLGELLGELDDETLWRLACVPISLLDADFQRDDAWLGLALAERRAGQPGTTSCLSDVAALELAGLVYDVASITARESLDGARLQFGMSLAVASTFAALDSRSLLWLSQSRAHWVRPRWQEQPRVWQRLIATAGLSDASRLPVGIRAVNRLLADLNSDKRAANETRRSRS